MMSESERKGVLCRHHESATKLTNSRSIWSCWAFSVDSAFVPMDASDLRFALFFYSFIMTFCSSNRYLDVPLNPSVPSLPQSRSDGGSDQPPS